MKDCEREPITFQGFTFSAGDSGIRFDSEISLERLGVEEGDILIVNSTPKGVELRLMEDGYSLEKID